MSALLRDAPIGQIIRFVTRGQLYQYPEERSDFQIPAGYTGGKVVGKESESFPAAVTPGPGTASTVDEKDNPLEVPIDHRLSTAVTAADHESLASVLEDRQISKIMTRPEMDKVTTRADLEAAYTNATRQETIKTQQSRGIIPERTSDGVVLVDWYTTDDPENPQNWSLGKKHLVILQIYLYTLAIYIGSAMITPSQPYIEARFGVSAELASMGLSLYVAGYGIGPLLFSPMSEIPLIGRNPPYMVTLGIFLIVSIITAVVDNFPALMVLRFLQGFFGSPILATGGATIGDIFSLLQMPYYLTGWAAFATAGPALGPIISGFSVPHTNWHWSLWEIVWLAAPVYISLLFLLPETSASNILLRRAKRLRKLTGNTQLQSQSEIDQANISLNEIVVSNLWRPLQINVLDPAVLFTSIYTALMYSIFYSFFEVFPFKVFEPEIRTQGLGAPERRLVPALFATFLLPIGLFIFAWTGFNSPKIHWIYAASLFAGNDFARSSIAAGAIHFSRPMFLNLGVGPGVSLLAGLTFGGVLGIYALYFFGANLRARSRFAI
ncbi:hypothetical protein DV737_g2898, partial [Chaetothyriales sp. CBS 132003]